MGKGGESWDFSCFVHMEGCFLFLFFFKKKKDFCIIWMGLRLKYVIVHI